MSGPDRIWAFDYDLQDNDGTWRTWQCWSEDHPKPLKATEYIRRDPAVIAALPEVQAMIAEAVAKERGELADKAVDRAEYLEDAAKWGGSKQYLASIKGGAIELRQHAAAIRKRGEGMK